MSAAIQVEKVSKKYTLGTHQHSTLGGLLSQASRLSARAARDVLQGRIPAFERAVLPELWALRDVSLSIQPGEVVGIVGRNGNGKSTLLKILSRITLPTVGRVRIQGSLASLLEVGTGFHPELTGRENIFLNGAILGMTRRQIRDRLDEIVAFSEVEQFLDTPVKRYSSGMYVRLAFAVAAHLEPDILLVDEVLAVGDGAFQKKCLGKIQSVGQSHRTVLFVSHSLPAVRSICSRVILLNEGEVAMDGPTDTVLAAYNKLLQAPRRIADEGIGWRLLASNGNVRVSAITARDAADNETWSFKQGQDVHLRIEYESFETVPNLGIYLGVNSLQSGEVVTTVKHVVTEKTLTKGARGAINISFPNLPLRPGEYALTLGLTDSDYGKRYDFLDHHQNLPWLCISSDDKDFLQLGGYVSIPSQIAAET